jgi:hypothetical protein
MCRKSQDQVGPLGGRGTYAVAYSRQHPVSDRPIRYGMILLNAAPAILRVRANP